MFLLDSELAGQEPDLIYSASDLVIAAQCEYQLLRKLDERLGRAEKPDFEKDELLARTAVLGDVHEHTVLAQYLTKFGEWNADSGTGVYDVVPASDTDRATLLTKHSESIAALHSGADVVFQAAFFDGQFHGRSDFLVKQGDAYAVFDTKLARHAKATALLQLAAYGDQLIQAGIAPVPMVSLILGNGKSSDHRLADLLPVFRERRSQFLDLTRSHRASGTAVVWGSNGFTACGRCDYCAEQVTAHRDLLMVAGMSLDRRRNLMNEGVTTIDQLAAMNLPAGEPADGALAKLRDQARMQTGAADPDGAVTFVKNDEERTISYRVLEKHTLGRLPKPSPGDIFFDFEGDPLWQDPADGKWGLEYLFGVVETPCSPDAKPPFRPFWAHSRAEERQAFTDFLDYVTERRRQYPDMHIYHYADYEKAALRRLSLMHVVGEDAVNKLLRDGVLIDLYATVRNSLRISENSYSIKKLEPLYMGSELRHGNVTDAGASVVAYADFCAARNDGKAAEAERLLKGIADYNEYDCLSTLELRNWLLTLAGERGISPAQGVLQEDELPQDELLPEEAALLDYVAALPSEKELSADDQAIAMVAAAVGYHRREDRQFWWGHFDRLNAPVEAWAKDRNVFTVERADVVDDWARPTPRSNPARTIRLSGTTAEGSDFRPGSTWHRMYDAPFPEPLRLNDDGKNQRSGQFGTEIVDLERVSDRTVLTVKEKLKRGDDSYEEFPVALTPDEPIRTKGQREALSDLARTVGGTLPELPRNAALELLRRAAPRLQGLDSLPPVAPHGGGYVEAITKAVAALERSYLAVQGPPGTGKTHVGSHVIANLVAQGWKVGVVGQSHAVVENMLRAAIVKAGVPAEQVAKKTDESEVPWEFRTDQDVARLLAEEPGCLVGGTAWTMTGSNVPADSMDLLVIDEAGQFSLANTLAVCKAAKRLLLLGDPQQLPQVTQGTHPEPVDESALGWLSKGYATLPPDFGYFLADSWRMHPDLCRAVSELSYEGRLEAASAAGGRHLDGLPAGVECVRVPHRGNSTLSVEEAEEVVRQIQRHLGLPWTESPDAAPRSLEESDILVVAAYNAQVQKIREHLHAEGLDSVRVGTVDKFQGQEAPVVIVSMACSAVSEAPRGMEFLLNRNRLNVAISRGQWRAVIIRSPELTNFMPSKPEALEELGAFIGLCSQP